MKLKKLTVKIIVSFFFLLLFTHVAIFFLIRVTNMEQAKRDHAYYHKISLFAFTEFIEKRFKPYSIDEIKNNKHYQNILSDVEGYNLNVVITDVNNKILMYSQGDKTSDYYCKLLADPKDEIDRLRNPFPIQIPFLTGENEKGYLYLFHEYDTSSSETLFLTSLIGLFIFNLIMLFFFSRRFTRPLDEFDKVIRSISKGDFSARVKINAHDEFKQLADAFNSMACRIKQSIVEQKETSANISHELRSPLTRIRVALQILKDITAEKCSEGQTYFESIDKEIEDMDVLIDGILRYYRIDNDSSQTREDIDIIDMLKNELSKQTNYFDLLNIKSINNIDVETYSVKILSSIRSIFENIISNASKYAKKDSNFTVSAIKYDNDLKITFENSIEKNSEIDIEKIFQPFYRGNNIDDVKGSGMGLAIAKKVADLNNCDLSVEIVENVFKVIFVVKS
ncbi:MAG: HAMP domain-containing protein [Candidatus Delongbacteria bacterium]|nr:HAMP domain-containing protein [Candidatus Delongbacteria bacterium]